MMMSSSKVVTEYESPVVKGILEWEIRNVGLQLKVCDGCWTGKSHSACSDTAYLNSGTMKLTAGIGKLTHWRFHLNSTTDTKCLCYSLYFDGLFEPDGNRIREHSPFHYNVILEKSLLSKVENIGTFHGKKYSRNDKPNFVYGEYNIPFQDLKSIWPDGNLKIVVKISHLPQVLHEVVNSSQLLDFDESQDSLTSCYGNLMNNPELSDFKIICDDTTFHAHKFIFSVRSPVFRAMLEPGMSQTTKSKLRIKDMPVKTVELMFEYIYKGSIYVFPEEVKEKIELLDCAEKYKLDGLKSVCMRKLFSNLPTEKDVGELAMAAFTYGANDRAIKAIKDFCMKNHVKLMQNPEYKKLFLANPQAFVN